ncbi:MarR family transcriptional regulator [Clostridium sp.]|uniref:MarR family transcriptional regulator n=1 Tax=Clostridium sp. TaxID=1506 RepID=UPI001B5FABC3|nr:MarR family transcriptional regulator [Clostridium sp.]MBP3915469.1 MarR family transcriptional regulator [Clostridium sp.]
MEMKDKILEVLKTNEPMRPGDIAKECGIDDKKELDKLIKELKKEEKIYSPKRCFYTIK